jgi:hypothetical protein
MEDGDGAALVESIVQSTTNIELVVEALQTSDGGEVLKSLGVELEEEVRRTRAHRCTAFACVGEQSLGCRAWPNIIECNSRHAN